MALTAASMLSSGQEYLELDGVPRFETPVRVIQDPRGIQPVGDRIRICTYNIENFTDGFLDGGKRSGGRARRQAQAAAAILDEVGADVVIIQEIENARALKMLNHYLKDPFPVGYITKFGGDNQRNQRLNIAVLSRFAVASPREIDFGTLRGAGAPPRGVVNFTLELGEDHRLLVYGVHLKSNWGEAPRNAARRRTALQIIRNDADHIRSRNGSHAWEMIVMGDMNVDPENESFATDYSLRPLADWIDLWEGQPIEVRTTIPQRHGDPTREFPAAAFDRIIVSPDLAAEPWVASVPSSLQKGVNTQNIDAEPGRDRSEASDHYPVFTDIWRTPPAE